MTDPKSALTAGLTLSCGFTATHTDVLTHLPCIFIKRGSGREREREEVKGRACATDFYNGKYLGGRADPC